MNCYTRVSLRGPSCYGDHSHGRVSNDGVCLRITFNADGTADSQPSWSILESTAVLAQGGGLLASATGWYSLELTLSGGVASAVIDGTIPRGAERAI